MSEARKSSGAKKAKGISRRGVLGVVGAALATTVVERQAAIAKAVTTPEATRLEPGATIGPWTVTERGRSRGAVVVTLALTASQETVQLELLARDAADPREPVATTDALAIYLANAGDGATRSREAHAKLARQIAKTIAPNDGALAEGLLTRRVREERYAKELFGDGATPIA